MPTLEEKFLAAGGRPSGFDYLRVGLATAVIFFHSMDLMAGRNVAFSDFGGVLRPVYALMLPMFFALSGFLVAGSLARSRTLMAFLGLRVLRLFPALAIETVLTALLIGPVFTHFTSRAYFSDRTFRHYFMTMFGDIHYTLPGVFVTHPFQTINAHLWTVPWEISCYAAIALLAVMGAARRTYLLVITTVVLNIVVVGVPAWFRPPGVALTLPGIVLVLSFLYGLCFYVCRTLIAWNGWAAAAALAAFLILAAPPISAWGDDWLALPGAYVTVFVGLADPQRSRFIASGDYSYGMYVYGYPVQQSVLAVCGRPLMPWWANFVVSMTVVVPLAAASWHLAEKHAARLQGRLFALEARYVAWRMSLAVRLNKRRAAAAAAAGHST